MSEETKDTYINIEDLVEILKSESVFTILRSADKRPSQSGVDECEDSRYQDLYAIVKKLRSPQPTIEP